MRLDWDMTLALRKKYRKIIPLISILTTSSINIAGSGKQGQDAVHHPTGDSK
jgi:hypothetical protein